MADGLHLGPIDSLQLEEADSVSLGFPTALKVDAREILVSDGASGRVLRFGRDGALRGGLGRRGQGPGEFLVPGAITLLGDSVVVVADWQLERLSLFDRATERYRQTIPSFGLAWSLITVGDTVMIGMYGRSGGSSSAVLYPGGDSLYTGGEVPVEYLDSPGIRSVHPYVSVANVSNHLITGFTGSNTVYDSITFNPTQSFVIPAALRRPMPPPDEMIRRFESDLSDSLIAAMGSPLVAMFGMDDERVLTVHMDVTVNGQLVTADAWISVVDVMKRKACVDARLKSLGAGKPVFDVVADTLFVLDQRLNASASPESWLHRYRIDDGDCSWRRIDARVLAQGR